MIIYHDSGGRRLFGDLIDENGQKYASHYPLPGKIVRLLCRRKMLKRFPKADPDDPMIIVFDTATSVEYLFELKKKYPEKYIIFWFWNRIDDSSRARMEQAKAILPVWSYSPSDCKLYGLKYNTQFYFDSLIPDDDPKEQDASGQQNIGTPGDPPKALFIGREKEDRLDALERIISALKSNGVTVETQITRRLSKMERLFLREKLIPYMEVVEKTKKSDILIDCYGSDTAGCSLRVMEAMFFGKKLVTDNRSLADYDFYDSHNIYIMGEDKRSLKEFIEEPCVPVPEEIRNKYRFSEWIKRFSQED